MYDELYDEAKVLICETLGIPEEALEAHTHLVDDLGLDATLSAELAARIEERFGIRIPAQIVLELATLDDVVAYLSDQSPRG